MHINGDIKLTTAQLSVQGRKERNEDSLGFFMPIGNLLTTKGACALIADGVSTAEAGAEASEYCVREFINDYFDTPDIWTVKNSAQKVLTAINRSLYARSHEYLHATRGLVCTLSVLIIKSRTAHLFHIGDSRIYRLRQDKLELLTEDHLTPLNESNSCLSRAMGMDIHLGIDYRAVDVKEGDIFLLSTDGIHDYVPEPELVELIQGSHNLHEACDRIVTEANRANSPDNLSCQLVRVDKLASQTVDDMTRQLTRLPFPPDLSPGMKIDGYLIEKELYASSRSQLYKVLDEDTGQWMVMKTPSVNYEDDPAYIERFVMEEWVGSRIQSPHVVKVLNQNRPKHFLYYLMEYVEGITLERWIEEHPTPVPAQAIKLVQQVAEGLKAFHQRETLHQDLKPGNIMVTPDQNIKIVDFGSVHIAGIDEIFVPLERDRILGTVHYTDPVYRLGQHTGITGDLYSLATITYEIFTHHLPFGESLEHCNSQQHLRRLKYIPSERYNPILPIWFDRTLEKALSIDPSKRYHDLDSFLQDLTHPNPEFLEPRQEEPKVVTSVHFWQALSAFWFVSLIFLVVVFWFQG